MQQTIPYIPRPRLLDRTLQYIEEAPVTVLLGARQTGKTTLSQMTARAIAKNSGMNIHTFDLERAASRAALSTPEIAEDLTVSVNTVRTHIKNIYSKLGVHSRYEAVSKGRELGLL